MGSFSWQRFSHRELPLILIGLLILITIGMMVLYIELRVDTGSLTFFHETGYYLIYIECVLLMATCAGGMFAFYLKRKPKPKKLLFAVRGGAAAVVVLGVIVTLLFYVPSKRKDVHAYFVSYVTANSAPPYLFNKWQEQARCCGVTSLTNYLTDKSVIIDNDDLIPSFPNSCCIDRAEKDCGKKVKDLSNIIKTVCVGDDNYIKLPEALSKEMSVKFGWSIMIWINGIVFIVIFEIFLWITRKEIVRPPPQQPPPVKSNQPVEPVKSPQRVKSPKSEPEVPNSPKVLPSELGSKSALSFPPSGAASPNSKVGNPGPPKQNQFPSAASASWAK